MKLHLPKLLTAALIAAFVSFTQASGTTLDNAVLTLKDFTQGSIDTATQAGWTLTNIIASESGVFTSGTDQAYITKNNNQDAWATQSGTRCLWSAIVSINVNSLGESGTGVLIESANSVGAADNARYEGLAYDASGNQKLVAAWQGKTWSNLTVTDNLKSFADEDGNVTVGVVYKGDGGTSIYVGGSVATNKDLKGGNSVEGKLPVYLANNEGIKYNSLYLFNNTVSDDDMKAMLASMRVSVTWTGSHDSNWDTKTENWVKTGTQDPATFSKKADVTFGADVQAKVVNVVEDATATAMNVTGDYTFKVAEDKALVADGLTLPDGAQTLTFDMASGASTKLVGGLTLAGKTLNLTGAGKATLPNLTLNGGTLNVSSNLDITDTGNATVVTSQDGQASTISVQGGTTTVTGGIHFKGGNGSTIKIGTEGTAAKLVTGRLEVGDNTGGTSYLTIGANGTLIITSTNDVHGADGNYKQTGLLLGEWGQKTQTSVAGKLYAKDVNLRQGNQPLDITIQSGGVVAVKGINRGANHNEASAVTMNENSKLILGADGFINDGGNWTITLNGGEIGMTEATTTLARAMNVAGGVTFNTAKYTWSGSADTLVLNPGVDGGTMTVSGNLTGTGSITKTGAGELILSGTANVLGDTITLNGGTLSLTGAFNLDALTVQGSGTEYVGDGGVTIPTGSGFAKTSGTITVVDKKAGTLSIGKDATFTYGSGTVEVNAETGVATLSGEVDYSTLWVNGTDEVSYSAAQTLAGAITVGTVHLNHEGATVAMDMAATIALVIKEGASTTVNATADTSISSLTGLTSNAQTFTVAGDHTVTLTSANTVNSAVEIGGTAKVKLGDKNALGNTSGVIVHTGATLDVNGAKDQTTCIGVTLDGGTLANNGAAASHGSKQLIKDLTVAKDSKVDAAANDFGVINGGYATTTLTLNATLEKVGSHDFHLANTTVTGSGAIKVTQGAVWFGRADGAAIGSYASDFIMNGGDIKGRLLLADDISVTTTADGGTFSATVNTNGHSITFDGDRDLTASGAISGNGGITKNGEGTLTLSGANTYTGDTVVKGGTLDIQGSISAGSKVKVAENATLAGKTEDISMSIAVGKTATIEAEMGFSPKDSGVTFYSDNEEVKIENTGKEEITYDIAKEKAKVTADELVAYSEDAPIVVNNEVNVSGISNLGDAALTLTQIGTKKLESITNYGGQVTLQGVGTDPIELKELSIGTGSTVAVYTEGAAFAEGTVTITETLAAGSATLLANLTIEDKNLQDTVLPLLDVHGGGDNALTLGSQFGIVEGTIVSLDEVTIAAIEGMKEGDSLALIKAGQAQLTYLNPGYDGMDYGQLFQRTEGMLGNYVVYAKDDAFGVTKLGAVPEPTTGTLSLLALMALAARRRRK